MKSDVSKTQVCDYVIFVLVIDGLYHIFAHTLCTFIHPHMTVLPFTSFLCMHPISYSSSSCYPLTHFVLSIFLPHFLFPWMTIFFVALHLCWLFWLSLCASFQSFVSDKQKLKSSKSAPFIRKYLIVTANCCKCIINSIFLPFTVCVCVCSVQSARKY